MRAGWKVLHFSLKESRYLFGNWCELLLLSMCSPHKHLTMNLVWTFVYLYVFTPQGTYLETVMNCCPSLSLHPQLVWKLVWTFVYVFPPQISYREFSLHCRCRDLIMQWTFFFSHDTASYTTNPISHQCVSHMSACMQEMLANHMSLQWLQFTFLYKAQVHFMIQLIF